jgi:hypothetical protein
MNSNQRNIRLRRCVVCAYPFAEEHHIYPQRKDGIRNELLLLCPNHHQFANIIQVMIENGSAISFIKEFAERDFDEKFNKTVLMYLIYKYYKYYIIDLFHRKGLNVEFILSQQAVTIDGMILTNDMTLDKLFGNKPRRYENFLGLQFETSLFSLFSPPIRYGDFDALSDRYFQSFGEEQAKSNPSSET